MPIHAPLHHEIARLIEARDWQRSIGCIEQAFRAAHAKLPPDPAEFDAIGTLFSRVNEQRRALEAFEQAVSLEPNNPHFIFNRATVRRFLGQIAEAEEDYDRVIALKPDDYEAHKNRSDLRPQSVDVNHIDELEALLARGGICDKGQVQVRYALAKEYEDLGNYAKSFQHLQAGAKTRRDQMRYDVAIDVATIDLIIKSFPAAASRAPKHGDSPAEDPIFIVGLPRSGSTLVERILSSHSTVIAAGELPDFALSVIDAVCTRMGQAKLSRGELIVRSAGLDFAALGRDYLRRAQRTLLHDVGLSGKMRFTDKMPLNYLYCGLIRRALPKAKIVHVNRQPMAACYAIYKTLFEHGYPFSYDLQEVGRYYIAYRRLMDHWQASLPKEIYNISYEALVADQLGETRKLLDFCGLAWQEACLEFHRNPSASTTASAVQVRNPLYDSSVDQWRHYAQPLAPLREQLSAAGLSTDNSG